MHARAADALQALELRHLRRGFGVARQRLVEHQFMEVAVRQQHGLAEGQRARLAQRDDLSTPERAFLWAVVAYLPLGMAHGDSPVSEPHDRNTRATALEAALYRGSMQLESPDVAAVITRALHENSRLWQDLCAKYSLLKVDVAT